MRCFAHKLFFITVSATVLSILFAFPAVCAEGSKDDSEFMLYLPEGLKDGKKYPLVIALSPTADAASLIRAWKSASDRYKFIILSSKKHSNDTDSNEIMPGIISKVLDLFLEYPIDRTKVIASGVSGGAMGAYDLCYLYPDIIIATVANVGMIRDYFIQKKAEYPEAKVAVFLASPGDFRYDEMKRDEAFLKELNWETKWIEFGGGHRIAPSPVYEKAAGWLSDNL